jgi:hypothetical protein
MDVEKNISFPQNENIYNFSNDKLTFPEIISDSKFSQSKSILMYFKITEKKNFPANSILNS